MVTTLGDELMNNPFLGYIREERGISGARVFHGRHLPNSLSRDIGDLAISIEVLFS